jgi:uncharacterized protein YecE (DUF72 family)
MPSSELLSRWAEETPDGFRFVVKCPQRVTHHQRLLGEAGATAGHLFEVLAALGPKAGPVLFQLPPFLKKDVDRLRAFLAVLPAGAPVAFEFRHASWFDEDVYAALRAHGSAALCSADTDDTGDEGAPLVPTAPWGYLRLRRSEYGPDGLAAWAARLRSQPWSEAWVFFKHEDEGRGPAFARSFLAALAV